MSTELFTPRPFSSRPSKVQDYGSTFSCSSSEASSRLAARLERSEYKRSRAKQRPVSSTRSHSRRKDSRSRRKNSSTRETRTKSEEDGVTSVWEVYRQNPYYYSDRMTEDKREHRNTWYGVPSSSSTNNQPSKRRPQSIHIGSSNYNSSEYQSWLSGRHPEKNSYESFNNKLNDSNTFEHDKELNNIDSQYASHHSPLYGNTQNYTELEGDYSLDKKGMYLSRSLSSSFSSYIGSSDEKEDSHGIYSAYDVASRSPYESMVSRRYSQSSLSSSNASWHQHQSPTLNYNLRDIPPLLDGPKSNQRPYSKKASFLPNESTEFQTIKETTPPAVAPKPKRFSSSYTIQLHSSLPPKDTSCSNANSTKDKVDGKSTTVRGMARKFIPTSVRHISSVYNKPDDRNNKPIENQILAVTAAHQENTPPIDKHKEVPQTNTVNDEKNKVVMRQKEPSNKTPEELASHRLSLQELIQLHEEQIAIQAQSAKTVLAHAYMKRSPETSPSRSNDVDVKPKTTSQYDGAKVTSGTSESKEDKIQTSIKQQDCVDYEVREVVVSQSSPFKVIELTDKTVDTLRGRGSRLKRHRTIGIVGYRHQIDRTAGEKVQTKLKRHTTVGIFSDFTDGSEGLTKSREALKQELQKDSPFKNEDLNHDNHAIEVEPRYDTNKIQPFPVKIFDIEANSAQQETEQVLTSLANEQPIQNESAECWFSPEKDFMEKKNETKSPDKVFVGQENVTNITPEVEDSTEKAESTSSVTMKPQQDLTPMPKPITTADKYTTTFHEPHSRNSHSPVVELVPERKGNPTAYYKSSTPHYAYSNGIEQTAHTSNSLLHASKSHSVPVAQVSPVSHSFGSQDIIEGKSLPLVSSPPPEPPSAHEMYETRLALWDLLPRKDKSSSDLSEHQSNEERFLLRDQHPKQSYSKEKSTLKFIDQPYDRKISLQKDESRFSQNFQRLDKTEEYYLSVIDNLKAENRRLKEKSDAEKREFKRMYEEQKKVANAYQKLEDRYRRRVHELQDALASCTCQGSLMLKESNLKSSHLNHQQSKENHTYKMQESSKSGMRMFEELEEWLSEQSKNSKAPKVNAESRDSLISSSSDLTGTGWDEHYMSGGDIDEVNGTHV